MSSRIITALREAVIMEGAEPSGEEISARRPLRTLESTKLGACAVRAPLRPHARASIAMPSRPLNISRASAPPRLCVEKTKRIAYARR